MGGLDTYERGRYRDGTTSRSTMKEKQMPASTKTIEAPVAQPAQPALPTEQFETKMRELLAREDQTLWAQGDLLLAQRLSERELGDYARKFQRSKSILKERAAVAEAFPEAEGWRDARYAFNVYVQLRRIPAGYEEDRRKLLNSRTTWYIDEMSDAVTLWLKERGLGGATATGKDSQGRRLANAQGFNLNDGETSVTGKCTIVGKAADEEGMTLSLDIKVDGLGRMDEDKLRYLIDGKTGVIRIRISA